MNLVAGYTSYYAYNKKFQSNRLIPCKVFYQLTDERISSGTGTLSQKRFRSFVPLRGEFYSTTPTIKLTEQAALKRDPH